MNVRTLCLSILYFQEATGYEIRKMATDGKYSHFVDASYGSIYPALTKLEQDGMVTCRMEVEAGKPSRKIYAITDEGREEFMNTLEEPPAKDVFRSEFLVIAMCAEFLSPEVVRKAVDCRIEHLKAEIEMLTNFASDASGTAGIRWAASYGMDCMQNSLAYLVENRAGLEQLAGSVEQLKTEAAE